MRAKTAQTTGNYCLRASVFFTLSLNLERSLTLPRIYFMQLSMGLFLKYRVFHRVLLLISCRVCTAWPRLSLESDIHFIKRACARHRDVREKKRKKKKEKEKRKNERKEEENLNGNEFLPRDSSNPLFYCPIKFACS